MAKAETLLNELFTQVKTLVRTNGHSADYTPFLGRLEVDQGELRPRAVSVLAFREAVKLETKEGEVREQLNADKAGITLSITVEAHALKTEQDLEPGILAQQMIADIKRCLMASGWTSVGKKLSYRGAAWQPPEQDVVSVQVQFACDYVERHSEI